MFSCHTVCQNSCSGHGYCDSRTKYCVCSTFWIENPFKANFGHKKTNCGKNSMLAMV